MRKLEHLTWAQNGTHLFQDVTFVLEERGLLSITADTPAAQTWLTHILCGTRALPFGSFCFDEFDLSKGDVKTRRQYQSQCVSMLVKDFQIFPQRSVRDNICMHLEVSEEAVKSMLRYWDIAEIEAQMMQDVPYEQQFRVLLARCMLKKSRMLVLDVATTALSEKELQQLYPLLQRCAQHMLVVVIGDTHIALHASRCIELCGGHIESDTLSVRKQPPQKSLPQAEHVHGWDIFRLWLQYHRRYRWAYRILLVLIVVMIGCMSSLFLSTRLDEEATQLQLLQANGLDNFLIEKHVSGDDGTIYETQYVQQQTADVQLLQEQLPGALSVVYAPNDFYMANAYLNGIYQSEQVPLASRMAVCEATSTEALGALILSGSYPQDINEVALCLSTARTLLRQTNLQAEKALGQTIYWYGIPLRITAIFKDDQNLRLETAQPLTAYMGNTYLFVKPGFMNAHPLHEMQSFPLSYKRLLVSNHAYAIDRIEDNSSYLSYTSGSMIAEYLPDLPKGNVVLDVGAAISLGFPAYEIFESDAYTNEQKLSAYMEFAGSWTGTSLTIQAYTSASSPSSSSIYQQQFTIHGFLFPSASVLDGSGDYSDGIAYVHADVLEDVLIGGSSIQAIIYHGDAVELKKGLEYIDQHPVYEAYFPDSLLYRLIVLDVKQLQPFLIICSIGLWGLVSFSIWWLHGKMCHKLLPEMSVYCAYGGSLQYLRRCHLRHVMKEIRHDLYIADICSSIFLALYLFLLIWQLHASLWTLWYLFAVPVISLLLYAFLYVAMGISIWHQPLVDPWFVQVQDHGIVKHDEKEVAG